MLTLIDTPSAERDIELLAELARILDAWDTEFTRAAEEAQVRKIEEN